MYILHILHGSYIAAYYSYIQNFILLTGLVSGKIVSYPPTLYVYEGNKGRLRCQNRSDDETVFYNDIRDALWYRLFPNGTLHELGANGPLFVQFHSLYFHPIVRPEDQGIYYCCKPGGSCSGNSTVSIAGMYITKYRHRHSLLQCAR